MGIWGIQSAVEDYIENRAIEKAKASIVPFRVDNKEYDITTVVFGISNSEFTYEYDGSQFVIQGLDYKMGASAFDHKCTRFLYSSNKDGNDVQLINDICNLLNQYDLDYKYIDGYGYRGFLYGNCYIFGEYDASYLNGQYLEISLRPTEGPNTILRFDLELSPNSLEYEIISDLKRIDHIKEENRVASIENLLGLIKPMDTQKMN